MMTVNDGTMNDEWWMSLPHETNSWHASRFQQSLQLGNVTLEVPKPLVYKKLY